ncbi:MAG: hypothetical protein JSV27_02310 [Candidatus Bathyarchaeota archaeon]|nr:MAG: hypothetical protein JSV27_02310 [Candidatus Bathyarchaeota archaeon]
MEKETLGRFDRETRSFYALVIVNIVGAGLAMSFGVATVVNNLIPMINEWSIQLLRTAFTGLALGGFVFAIRWLILSAGLFGEFDDVRDELKEVSGKVNEETLTQLIVRNLAFYRDNKPTIDKLKLGSRVTGAFFLLSGATAALNVLTVDFTGPIGLLTAAFGTLLCIALGIVGVYSPYFF